MQQNVTIWGIHPGKLGEAENLDSNIEMSKIAVNYLRDKLKWSLPEESMREEH